MAHIAFLDEITADLRLAMALTGSDAFVALDFTEVVLGPRLKSWAEGLAP
jgi:isopentenyl diphosphate isomerase/L-lactate dehydrogenase-like FMN-dependent dehydrogenase